MAGSDANYQIVYRGESLTDYVPGGLVFFQRPKENGGGFWLGRTLDGIFWFEIYEPVSLSQGLIYLQELKNFAPTDAKSSQEDNNLPLF